jgi:putative hydrolase of the HAD superfamily
MTQRFPKAILFDLDDTILALSRSAGPCWRQISRRYAPQIPGITADELYQAIEESRTRYWEDPERHRWGRLNLETARREIVAEALRRKGIDDPPLAALIADAFTRERQEAIEAFPGAIDTLRRLRARGVRLGLITNGDGEGQRKKIERFGLADLFDVIVIEGEFGIGKPDERVYRYALDRLGVTPEEAWSVGDNLEWDVQGPQRLGIFAIWVDSMGEGVPAGSPVRPDRTIRSVSELIGDERGNTGA